MKIKKIYQSANNSNHISHLTHNLYKYPASLSPYLTNSIITQFSDIGDTILDPFCGGGTTAIEGLVLGRRVICSDINSLACFVTKAKSSILNRSQLERLCEWSERQNKLYVSNLKTINKIPLRTAGGHEFIPSSNGLLHLLNKNAKSIENQKVRRVAQLTVLRTGQLCYDNRNRNIHPHLILRTFNKCYKEAVKRLREFSNEMNSNSISTNRKRRLRVINSDSEYVVQKIKHDLDNVALVLTSPPYPGIHVLYHRWQFKGRKETSLPYQLLDIKDGASESYYTLGPRFQKSNSMYFKRIFRIYQKLNCNLKPGTPVVQVVSFANPEIQLPKFLDTLSLAGLNVLEIDGVQNNYLTRQIPNRKWYNNLDGKNRNRQEFILFHLTTG